jgi:glycosyltransferase involved in cell wall biosynthesis
MKVNEPKVSVVIPCYNAAGFIGDALDSILAQSYGDHEVLVVNDGSPDTPELEEALRPYLTQIHYLSQENQGPGGARNTGIREARGEFVAFLDSDDAWEPTFLEEQVRLIEGDRHFDLVYADALLVGETPHAGRTYMSVTPSNGEVTFESLLRRECMVITSCVVARRYALIDAGLFDTSFNQSEDFEVWLRLAHRGGKIGFQRAVLARRRSHAESLTAESGSLLRAQVALCTKLLGQLDLSAEEQALLRSHRDWCAAHLALETGKRDLLAGRYGDAAAALTAASRVLGGRKLGLSALGARIAPGLLRRFYERNAGRPQPTQQEAIDRA